MARARLVAVPLTAALLVAIAVGAAARPAGVSTGSVDRQASIDAATVILTLIGMAFLAGIGVIVWALVTAERRRGRGSGNEPSGVPLRYQLLAGAVALGMLALLAVILIVSHSAAHHPTGGGTRPIVSRQIPTPKPLPYSIGVGGVTAGVASMVVAGFAGWWWLRRRRGRRRSGAFGVDLPDSETLAADVMAGLRSTLAELAVADPRREPDARRAVIAAWMAMTDAIGRHWREREPSEAPFEYLQQALTGAGVGPASAGRLTTLFEEARWGGRAVGEEMRADAIAALDAVHAELRAAA